MHKRNGNERPTAVSILMLKENNGKVPKGQWRRKLVHNNRFKTIYIQRNHSEEQVQNKIQSAFGVINFVALECSVDGHNLSRVNDSNCIDGKFAINRRGCLYLCEVSLYYNCYTHAC